MRKYTICGSNNCKFKKHNRLRNTGLTLNLSTFLPFVLWNLSEGRICLGMFLCQHLAFIFRVVTGWKRKTSRTKQIELIQQSYLTFETENFSCPVSCLTWKSPIVSSFSSFSRFALFCFFEMGFTFRVSQGQRKANEYWSISEEMIKNCTPCTLPLDPPLNCIALSQSSDLRIFFYVYYYDEKQVTFE